MSSVEKYEMGSRFYQARIEELTQRQKQFLSCTEEYNELQEEIELARLKWRQTDRRKLWTPLWTDLRRRSDIISSCNQSPGKSTKGQ